MKGRTAVVTALWVVVLGCILAATLLYGRFGGSLTAFLPQSGDAIQQTLVRGLQQGRASRLVLMAVEGGTSAYRRATARRLAGRLRRARGLFVLVAAGPTRQDPAILHFLRNNRYLLAPSQKWTVAALRKDLSRLVTILESPAGLGANAVLRDPTGAFFAAARPWAHLGGPATDQGVWVANHQALLLAVTRRPGLAIGAAQRVVARIRATWARLPHGGCRLQLAGTAPITVATNQHVATQARGLAIIDAVLVMLLLGVVYRRIGAVGASLVPMVTGGVVATAIVALAFPTVSMITLGFGTMLIGVAMDYPAYVLLHVGHDGAVARAARRVQSTLGLAVVAMVLGFATLFVSGLDGLVQLAAFAATGLVAAAFAARLLVPLMVPVLPSRAGLQGWDQRIGHMMARLHRGRWLVAIFAAAACAVLWVHRGRMWDDSVTALSPVSPALMATTQRLSHAFGAPSMTYEAVAVASSRQAALARSARLAPLLRRLRKTGAIGHYDMAALYLPTVATQRRRQRALPPARVLRRRLAQARVGLPLRPEALAPFVADVARARHAQPLTVKALPRALRARVEALLGHVRGRYLALIPLSGVKSPAQVRAAILGAHVPGVRFVDSRQTVSNLLRTYRLALMHDALIAAALMIAVVSVGLRSLGAALRVVAPMAAALLVDCGLLVLFGMRLTLLNVVALLLIAGLGMGYALFLGRGREARPLAPWLCAATTMTGFGVMALSTVSLLSTVGITVSVGALLALLFTAAWSEPEAIP